MNEREIDWACAITWVCPSGRVMYICEKQVVMSKESEICLKGAVCRILTLLKHKNTIICLQTFRKHVKLTYLFIWKTMLQSIILLWKCAVRPGISVFVINNFLFSFFYKQHNIISKIKQNKTADTYSTSKSSIKREGEREGQQEHKSHSFK